MTRWKRIREKRLALKKIRTSVENTRKELKEEHLRQGNAIQAVANYIKGEIETAENYLELQEKFAEIKKAERDAKIKADRMEKLMQYTDDISVYNLDAMNDGQFEPLLSTLKSQHEAKLVEEKRVQDELIAREKADEECSYGNSDADIEFSEDGAELRLDRIYGKSLLVFVRLDGTVNVKLVTVDGREIPIELSGGEDGVYLEINR